MATKKKKITTTVNKEPSNLTVLNYLGNVKIKLRIKDKVIEIANHNEGTVNLFKMFAKFVTGYFNYDDVPQYLDLMYGDESLPSTSMLKELSNLTKEYSESNATAVFTASILSDTISQPVGEYSYYLALKDNNKKDLAYMRINQSDIQSMFGNSGITAKIEWSMKLQNKE